jgi:site-specific recombinase XerD
MLYLQDLSLKNRSVKTVEWHQTALGFLQDYLQQTHPPLPLSQFTEREVRGWVAWLRTEPSATGKRRSASTINSYARSTHTFCSWLVQQGYLDGNPFGAVALPKAKVHPIQLVEPAVFAQLLLACQPPGAIFAFQERATTRNRALLWILLETGLLVSEVCALRLSDVDRQREKLRIQGQGPQKRHLILGPNSQRALITYLDQHRLKESGRDGEDAVFLTETGRRLTPNTITQLFLRLNERAGLTEQPVSPSMLRETFAVQYLQTGGDPFTLQKLLGRADLATIKRYQRLSEQMREKPTTNKNAGKLRDH